MSVLVANIAMDSYDERCIPETIHIKFTNGEAAGYKRSSKEISSTGQLSSFKLPKYEIEEKVQETSFDSLGVRLSAQWRSLEGQYKAAVEEAERLFLKEKGNIESVFEQRLRANDQLHAKLSKEMLGDYQILKKEMDNKLEALKDPDARLKMMTGWLRVTGMPELIEAAEMLERETDHILKKIKSPARKWDSFLSHVQKESADVCRNIKDHCAKLGLSLWYDKSVGRIDMRGMTDGVIESSVFTIVLTKEYFKRPFCVYEYCIALVAGKPVITVFEFEARYGGGPLETYKLNKLFKNILNHEMISINREYWDGFIAKLHSRIEKTLRSQKIRTIMGSMGGKSSILNNEDIAFLRRELRKDRLGIGARLFSSSEDGSTTEAFHSKCDDRGATLTVIESEDGKIFGGYTSASWSSPSKYKYKVDQTAWLFKARPYERINIRKGVKNIFYQAILCSRDRGPCFGFCDIIVGPNCSCCQYSYSKGVLSEFGEKIPFRLKRYEVFKIANTSSD